MTEENEFKRLFFGMEVHAPWPDVLPEGRLLDEENRHITLAFLGRVNCTKLEKELTDFPPPPFTLGIVGKFDQCLFLPPRYPHVVAWNVVLMEGSPILAEYQSTLIEWLNEKGCHSDERHGFTPHVTLARSPFNKKAWEKSFTPLPCFLKDIHLYESLGYSKYHSRWSHSLIAPFEEIEHTADIAYWIRGENFTALFLHAQIALAFNFPALLPFVNESECISIEDIIEKLNQLVFEVDIEIGAPFKAVSYHTNIETKDNIMHWEMIVDV